MEDKRVCICKYEVGPEYTDLGDCYGCIHNKEGTCPYGIYDDLKKEKKVLSRV